MVGTVLVSGHLIRQSVCEFDSVSVVSLLQSQETGDVHRVSRSWLIFKTPQVMLDVFTINLDLRLMRELNILGSDAIASAEYHEFGIRLGKAARKICVFTGLQVDGY